MPGPRAELLLQADTLSAGPVGAEPDAEHLIERIICRPVREHPTTAPLALLAWAARAPTTLAWALPVASVNRLPAVTLGGDTKR